jgi:hypothetical protein
LSERLRFSRNGNILSDRKTADHTRRAITRCRSWFHRGRDGRDEWAQFLAQAHISEEELIKVASQTNCVVARYPSWVAVAERLVSFLSSKSFVPRPLLSISRNLALPVAEFAAEELWNSVSSEERHLLAEGAKCGFRDSLTCRLAWSAHEIVRFELDRRLSRPTPGATEKGEAADTIVGFFAGGVAEQTARLLASYPVLLRLWSRQVENWQAFLRDFLADAKSFAMGELGLNLGSQAPISRVEALLSDPHNGGRSVIATHFCDEGTWCYKPRSGNHERGWFQLLAWLNAQGFPAPFLFVRVICGERHCWMENVRAQSVSNRHAAASYYFRAGALLYLLHILRGTDFHAGNIVASGTQPVMVDCETLLHARTRIPARARVSMGSILRTGMLPLEKVGRVKEEPSALGRLEKGAHRLTMDGRAVQARSYLDTIEDGFVTMHRFLNRNPRMRDAFGRKVRLFLPQTGRRIYRPTALYVEMLSRSHGAGTMVDGLYRSLFFQALCRDGAAPRDCVAGEVAALEDGDIPFFRGSSATPRPPLTGRELRRSLLILRERFSNNSH